MKTRRPINASKIFDMSGPNINTGLGPWGQVLAGILFKDFPQNTVMSTTSQLAS